MSLCKNYLFFNPTELELAAVHSFFVFTQSNARRFYLSERERTFTQ